MQSVPLLEARGISKTFPGTRALHKVDLVVTRGEVQAVVGENGAGKSTLMNILGGVYAPDEGQIFLEGTELHLHNARDAHLQGISVVHQELSLCPNLSIAENIFAGRMPVVFGGVVNWQKLQSQTKVLLESFGLNIDPMTPAGELSVATQQIVEIAKAASFNNKVLILDEPTSALAEREAESLFELILSLKNRGVGIVYISHKLQEVTRIADSVTVLRDGLLVGSRPVSEVTVDQIVTMMVGRVLDQYYPDKAKRRGEVMLSVRGLSSSAKGLKNISFELHSGEVLGLAGLVGAGRTELARAVFGADPFDEGDIFIGGQKVRIGSPEDAIKHGLGYVPEDRKVTGLFLPMSVKANIVTSRVMDLVKNKMVDRAAHTELAGKFVEALNIRTPHLDQTVDNLSGGNQQKVMVAKWLALEPRILLIDEPTRGVDVGAKAEIHRLLRELANQGMAIMMISSELPEVLGMSDRVLVMHAGRIVGEIGHQEATEERIMTLASGLTLPATNSPS